jgi:hypothetical protein
MVFKDCFGAPQVPGDSIGIDGHGATLEPDSPSLAVWHREFAEVCVSRR